MKPQNKQTVVKLYDHRPGRLISYLSAPITQKNGCLHMLSLKCYKFTSSIQHLTVMSWLIIVVPGITV